MITDNARDQSSKGPGGRRSVSADEQVRSAVSTFPERVECPVCKQPTAVTITHGCRVGKVHHVWCQCVSCELREMATQDERAAEAIEEAERSGV